MFLELNCDSGRQCRTVKDCWNVVFVVPSSSLLGEYSTAFMVSLIAVEEHYSDNQPVLIMKN